MRGRRSSPPFWFACVVAVALALAWRVTTSVAASPFSGGGHDPAPLLGFWGFILGIIGWLWNGLQAAGQLAIEALAWAVKLLQAGAARMANAIKDGADLLRKGFLASWHFLGDVYRDVLKPAWEKFWRWFDRAKAWLDRTFGPLLTWLRKLRSTLLDFWKTYVRPWLDLIDVTRKVARVLASLGLTWARKLDQVLGDIESKIEAPFRYMLGKLNDIINVINLVVGADGLLQRVALIRSLARDYQFAWKAIVKPYGVPISGTTRDGIKERITARTIANVESDYRSFLRDGSGGLAEIIHHASAVFRGQASGS